MKMEFATLDVEVSLRIGALEENRKLDSWMQISITGTSKKTPNVTAHTDNHITHSTDDRIRNCDNVRK